MLVSPVRVPLGPVGYRPPWWQRRSEPYVEWWFLFFPTAALQTNSAIASSLRRRGQQRLCLIGSLADVAAVLEVAAVPQSPTSLNSPVLHRTGKYGAPSTDLNTSNIHNIIRGVSITIIFHHKSSYIV